MSVKLLKAWLGIPDDKWENIRYFTKDIVKKSVNEINTKNTDIKISLTVNKVGNTTKSYRMTIDGEDIEQDQAEKNGEPDQNYDDDLDNDGLPKLGF